MIDNVKRLEDTVTTLEGLLEREKTRYIVIKNKYDGLVEAHEKFRQEYYKLLTKVKAQEND